MIWMFRSLVLSVEVLLRLAVLHLASRLGVVPRVVSRIEESSRRNVRGVVRTSDGKVVKKFCH